MSASRATRPAVLTPAGTRRAVRHLSARDPALAALIERVGPCLLLEDRAETPFASLVHAIVSQQLSTKAADTIHRRVVAQLGGAPSLTPAAVLAADAAGLREAGLSRPKVSYVRDLAARVHDGRLDLDTLEQLDDEQVIAAITSVKGLGRWSAEMFLMFRLNRPDVFPVADLGIVRGMGRILGMKRLPKPRTMTRAAERWRPYRTVACWYLWRLSEERIAPAPQRRTARERIVPS